MLFDLKVEVKLVFPVWTRISVVFSILNPRVGNTHCIWVQISIKSPIEKISYLTIRKLLNCQLLTGQIIM